MLKKGRRNTSRRTFSAPAATATASAVGGAAPYKASCEQGDFPNNRQRKTAECREEAAEHATRDAAAQEKQQPSIVRVIVKIDNSQLIPALSQIRPVRALQPSWQRRTAPRSTRPREVSHEKQRRLEWTKCHLEKLSCVRPNARSKAKHCAVAQSQRLPAGTSKSYSLSLRHTARGWSRPLIRRTGSGRID